MYRNHSPSWSYKRKASDPSLALGSLQMGLVAFICLGCGPIAPSLEKSLLFAQPGEVISVPLNDSPASIWTFETYLSSPPADLDTQLKSLDHDSIDEFALHHEIEVELSETPTAVYFELTPPARQMITGDLSGIDPSSANSAMNSLEMNSFEVDMQQKKAPDSPLVWEMRVAEDLSPEIVDQVLENTVGIHIAL